MPLLMIEPASAPPPEQSFTVPGGELLAFPVAVGQLLVVTDLEGGQPAAMFAVADDGGHFLSPHHTRVFSNSFVLRLGMRLVTNRRRPALVLGVSAPHLMHDLLMPVAGSSEILRREIAVAMKDQGIAPAKIADPVNLFLDVGVNLDGSLTPRGVSSKAGDMVVLRAVMDMICVIAAPLAGSLWSRPKPGPIGIQVRNQIATIRR